MSGFVKFCIVLLVVLTFIFNVAILVSYSETRIKVAKSALYKLPEEQVVDESVEIHCKGLNQHMWLDVCSPSIDFLCNVPLYPKAPNRRTIINATDFSWPSNEKYGERVFGFLRPPTTGSYVFAISSNNSSELWLSTDERSENSILIANVGEKRQDDAWTHKYDYWKYPTQISKGIELVADKKYYIEIIHVQGGFDNHFVVQWKTDSFGGNFSDIKEDYLLPYLIDDNSGYDVLIPNCKSCNTLTKENPFLLENHLTYAEHDEFIKVLPNFHLKYNKRDLDRSNLSKEYDSLLKHYQKTKVYPVEPKHKNIYAWPGDLSNGGFDATEMKQKVAMAIVKLFMAKLNAYYSG
jgi:hypothetical protein